MRAMYGSSSQTVVKFESQFGTGSIPYLNDHRIRGSALVPIAVYLEMALAAAREIFTDHCVLEDVVFPEPLVLPDSVERTVQLEVCFNAAEEATFEIVSVGAVSGRPSFSTLHAAGRIRKQPDLQTQVRTPQATSAMEFSLYYFGNSEQACATDRYDLLLRGAKFADRHGFTAVWTPERHLHSFGGAFPSPAVLSAALALITERVSLRAGSVVLPLQHPIRVAEEWSVVDNLSKGRVAASFASGWHEDDFVLAPENYVDRKQVMLTHLDLVRRLWRGEPVMFSGVDAKPTEARLFPLPIQRELPVWLTALSSADTFVTAGELGVNVLTNLLTQTMDELAGKIKLYRDSRAKRGHDPQTGKVTLLLHTFIGEDIDSVRDQVREPFCNYIRGTLGAVPNLAKALGLKVEIDNLSPGDVNDLLSAAFERYFFGASLLGTITTCMGTMDRLRQIGVNELGCFIDFGLNADVVLGGLHRLATLKELSTANEYSALNTVTAPPVARRESVNEIRARCPREISAAEHYQMLAEKALECGPSFRGVVSISAGFREAIGQVTLPRIVGSDAESYQVHPALLEAGFQVIAASLPVEGTYLPTGLTSLRLYRSPQARMWSHAVLGQDTSADSVEITADCRLLDDEGQVILEASGLRLRRADRVRSAPRRTEELIYELKWEPAPQACCSPGLDHPGRWLVLTDGSVVADGLAARLRLSGEMCIVVNRNDVLENDDPKPLGVGPAPPALRRVLQQASEAESRPFRGVVCFWSESTKPELTSSATLHDAERVGSAALLRLVQELAMHGASLAPKLFLVTRGTQPVVGDAGSVSIEQAPIWGLGRVIALEHPELDCTRIDLDNATASDDPQSLFDELFYQSYEDQIAFRDGIRYVSRLVRLGASRGGVCAKPFSLRSDRTYLIAGGHGVLGLLVARWLVERGARFLALASRSEPSAGIREQLRILAGTEVDLRSFQADVGKESDVVDLFAKVGQSMPPICGIIHAAGVIRDQVLLQMDRERLAAVMLPKVLGAWNLHQHSAAAPLDFFVMFSSAASLLGSPGQGNYTAANAFMDALSHYRRSLGLPSLTVNWGRWASGGGEPQANVDESLAARGLYTIKPEEAFAAMEWLLGSGCSQAAVMAVDWSRAFAAQRLPLLSNLQRQLTGPAILEPIGRFEPGELPAWLTSILQAQVARSLRLSPSQVDLEQPLRTLGLDSLIAIELKNFIELSTGVVLPLGTLLKGPSVSELAFAIAQVLSKIETGPAVERTTLAIKAVEELSDAEVQQMLRGVKAHANQ